MYNVAEVKVTQHPELNEAHSFEELKQSLENARENLSANKVMFDENAAQIKSVSLISYFSVTLRTVSKVLLTHILR